MNEKQKRLLEGSWSDQPTKLLKEAAGYGTIYFEAKNGKLSAGGAKALRTWLEDEDKNFYLTIESADIAGPVLAIKPYGSGGQLSKFIKAMDTEFSLKLIKVVSVI